MIEFLLCKKWSFFYIYYWTIQGFVSFTPVTIKIDRNWIVDGRTAIGSEINRVKNADSSGSSHLMYSLEPGAGGFQPFSIDPLAGIIYLNQSLVNQDEKNFSILVKAVNKDFQSIPSKIEIFVSIVEHENRTKTAPKTNFTPQSLYFFTVTAAATATITLPSSTRSNRVFDATLKPNNELDLLQSTTVVFDSDSDSDSASDSNSDSDANANFFAKNDLNSSKTTVFDKSFRRFIQNNILVLLAISVIFFLIVISIIVFVLRRQICFYPFRNSKNHFLKTNSFIKSNHGGAMSIFQSAENRHDLSRTRALSNRYDASPWEQMQMQTHHMDVSQKCHTLKTNGDQFEYPRNQLKFFDVIGEGAFGQVWRCEATDRNGQIQVIAVKTLKANANSKEKKDLISEMMIMRNLKPHPNVVRLLGFCSDKEPYFLLMEFIDGGKLQSYLRKCRNIDDTDLNSGHSAVITSHHLTSFVYQVAKGMAFLAENDIVHRDLAARNVLITSDGTCKVADFGFARDIADSHVYERKSESRLPIRWMAIESLYDNIFTSKSDVWAFGILMWEVITLGSTPYPGLSAAEVMRKVKDGYRLEKPDHCRRELYNVMYYCWNENAAFRPSFHELVDLLEKLLLTETDYIELEHFPDHSYYNVIHLSGERV